MSQKRGLKSSPDWPLKPFGYITHTSRLPKQYAPIFNGISKLSKYMVKLEQLPSQHIG